MMSPWMLLCIHGNIQMSHAGIIIIFKLVNKKDASRTCVNENDDKFFPNVFWTISSI